MRWFVDEGTRVERKRDGARGVVVNRRPSRVLMGGQWRPGPTLLDVRLDDPELRRQAGGDMTGDLAWLVSYFRAEKGNR